MEYTEYEVYAKYGITDIVTYSTLEDAIAAATKWSIESKDTEICIEKVTRVTNIKCFKNGGEV